MRYLACVLAAAGAFVAAVADDSDIADLMAALQPGSLVAADGLYAGMADILPAISPQVRCVVGLRHQHDALCDQRLEVPDVLLDGPAAAEQATP